MSSQVKLGFLALLSTAAAVPHYSHNKFHNRPSGASGHAYPTGGWPGLQNSTALSNPAGPTGLTPDEQTTTILQTDYSTETLVSTIYASKSGNGQGPSEVVAADASTGAASVCGQTIYVTATDKVTVTVHAGQGYEAPSQPPAVPASSAAVVESPAVSVSSAAPVATPVVKESATPKPEDVYSILPVKSDAPVEQPTPAPVATSKPESTPEAVPSSSMVPVETPVPSPTPVEPTSQAAPSSTPQPPSSGYSGSKRGLAYNEAKLCDAFSGGSFGFAYNWGSKREEELPKEIPYVPMCHRPGLQTPEEWLADVKLAVSQGTKAVMGFNEPDHAEQANLAPNVACTAWKKYMNPIAELHPEVTIIGSSVTNGPAPMGLDWLTRFYKECPDAIVHAENIHFYDIWDSSASGTVSRFQQQVEKAAAISNKKVWVTEFGLNPGAASPEQTATFVKEVTKFMDGSDTCQGYSYFMVGNGANQLNGSGPVFEAYASA
ncbi:glycosyl hydrolase catalytic core-domain-containing protein [Massariosphaeria phaeospora]|uniref:Glycosyl hydrolase catalytic core-domain-containing protein n=1 Tax=Massariosphaeria phaeospora TaxID=100035 RepID=A0A7C8IKM2_9PLEO|nr:glycosyl hydrolase catalytic core-domain-containing protein [Massariosphaeria phaeospora]